MQFNQSAIENIGMFMMKNGNKETVTEKELLSVVSFLEHVVVPKGLTDDEQDYTLDHVNSWILSSVEKASKKAKK